MSIKYRPDIDGLRAIAVLSVVLYHYGIGGLQGGFVGVDVFFVISGYLITSIIHTEIQRGDFTIATFYERRARRIFPALFVVLFATMAAGWWILLPSDLASLGQSSVATILFFSNVLYMLNSGYFDSSSEFNPLLHTWSLGVEEQFYLGLPLVMMFVAKYWARGLCKVLAITALLSFVACVLMQPILAKAVFFLSPFRAWELLLGSLLAIGAIPEIRSVKLRNLFAILALGALLGSVLLMKEGVDFPGWKVGIPVMATALLLHVGASGGSRVSSMLSWAPLVYVGLISYSLYLWHWPLLVLVKYGHGMENLSLAASVMLLAIAFLVAVASYRLIERPFRKAQHSRMTLTQRQVFMSSAAAALLLFVIGGFYLKADGIPSRVPAVVAELDRARTPAIPFKGCDGEPVSVDLMECRIGASGVGNVALVWGDSWAMAWAPALHEVLKREGRAGILAVRSACAPLPGVKNLKSPACLERNAEVLEWIRHHRPQRVYLIAAWPAWVNFGSGYPLADVSGQTGNDSIFSVAFPRTVQEIQPYVNEVVVVAPTPGAPSSLPYRLALVEWRGGSPPPPMSVANFRKRVSEFWKVVGQPMDGVRIIDPAPWFCDALECRYSDGSKILYRDGHHLSVAGAAFVAGHMQTHDEKASAGTIELKR